MCIPYSLLPPGPFLQLTEVPVVSTVVAVVLHAGHAPLPRTARVRTEQKELTVSGEIKGGGRELLFILPQVREERGSR